MLHKFYLDKKMGTTSGVSITFWKICAYVTAALNIVPDPQQMCEEYWPGLVSLLEQPDTSSSHPRTLSTTAHCFHQESSSVFNLLQSLKVQKNSGSLGYHH